MDSGQVLVVDDDTAVGNAMRRVLVRAGFRVVLVENGASALAIVGAGAADVVVSDLELADMRGRAIVDALHRVDAALPVIVLTGRPLDDEELCAVAPYTHGCFQKPVDVGVLCSAVGDAMRGRPPR